MLYGLSGSPINVFHSFKKSRVFYKYCLINYSLWFDHYFLFCRISVMADADFKKNTTKITKDTKKEY